MSVEDRVHRTCVGMASDGVYILHFTPKMLEEFFAENLEDKNLTGVNWEEVYKLNEEVEGCL